MTASPDGAVLSATAAPRRPGCVVLLLHGGSEETSHVRGHWFDPAVLRLVPIARAVARHVSDAAVFRLRFAEHGWNGTGAEALRDAGWALGVLRPRYPGVPIVLLGHSLGGRVAARLLGADAVAGAVLLAPWLPAGDPVEQTAGRPLVVLQGTRDTECPEPGTRAWLGAARDTGARIDQLVLPGLEHTMLRRWREWHRRAWQGVRQVRAQAAHR
ncbi:alpha/beta hydrolase [Nakamurella endophytica]|uniref:alpha/beta hydrolase n=1 Tax=Nakamurella endophytica TaxID=1748367 RepID=UPI0016678E8A|nr:alpha/beta fold hydrolase [Nakamurella endophytica]